MTEPLHTRVTRINGRWHVRLMRDHEVLDEMACQLQEDIGWCCYYMLRWYDKLGYQPHSPMADAARDRGKHKANPVGKVDFMRA